MAKRSSARSTGGPPKAFLTCRGSRRAASYCAWLNGGSTKSDLVIEPSHGFRQSLDRWRARWDVPRYVFLSVGDNRLVLDLEQDSQAAEIRAELVKLTVGGSLAVQEVVPSLDEAWLFGPGGHFYSELIVSLVLRSDLRQAPSPSVVPLEGAIISSPPTAALAEQSAGPVPRNYPPGSEWLFVKLYCPRSSRMM